MIIVCGITTERMIIYDKEIILLEYYGITSSDNRIVYGRYRSIDCHHPLICGAY